MNDSDLDAGLNIISNEIDLICLTHVARQSKRFISTSLSPLPRAVCKGEQAQHAREDSFIDELSRSLRELLSYEPPSTVLLTGANPCDPNSCLSMHA